jgi:uncharacterized protein (TIGR03437 family)
MYKTVLLLSALLIAVAPGPVGAQSFDTSGTAGLSGPYLFRYVNFFNDATGNLTESCSLTGVMTFDGQGKYTLSNTQLFDSLGSGTGYCASLGGGTYGVQSNGIAQLDNPLYPATLFGAFSPPLVIASSTEDDYFDLFIAVQASSTALANSTLSGAYTVGTLDFLNASSDLARQGYFTLNADGKGNIAAFTVTGSAANVNSGNNQTQNVGASTYSLSGTTGGTLTIPIAADLTDQTQIIDGAKTLYASADGNWFVGGSVTGSDMIFGFRAPSGAGGNALLNGTYFLAGMQEDSAGGVLGAFYGSINTVGDGNLHWHERFDYIVYLETYDYTVNTPVTIGANGSYFDGSAFTYFAGANGMAVMTVGYGPHFSLTAGIRAPSVTPASTVWINPVGIFNSATYAPITNSYAPGELVSLFGNFGVSAQAAKSLPISTELNGVQLFVNGRAAPVFFVSPGQINALIPFEISDELFATFQVSVNGAKSNKVTVYVDNSAPGIYTDTENGIGAGAILHANYTGVSDKSPALPGETVLLFMNGLGNVTPRVNDGAAATSSPLSYSDEYQAGALQVYLDDGTDSMAPGVVVFAGLAPGLAGLYQVNFTLPGSGLTNGDVDIILYTDEAITEMATISVSGFSQAALQFLPSRPASRLPRRVAVPGRAKGSRNPRRALPERLEQKL